MANIIQSPTVVQYTNASTVAVTFSSPMTNPSLIVALLTLETSTSTATIADNKNGSYAIDATTSEATQSTRVYIGSVQNAQTAAATVTATISGGACNGFLACFEVAGRDTSLPLDVANTQTPEAASVSVPLASLLANDTIFSVICGYPGASIAGDASFTFVGPLTGSLGYTGYESMDDSGGAGTKTIQFGNAGAISGSVAAVAYKKATAVGSGVILMGQILT